MFGRLCLKRKPPFYSFIWWQPIVWSVFFSKNNDKSTQENALNPQFWKSQFAKTTATWELLVRLLWNSVKLVPFKNWLEQYLYSDVILMMLASGSIFFFLQTEAARRRQRKGGVAPTTPRKEYLPLAICTDNSDFKCNPTAKYCYWKIDFDTTNKKIIISLATTIHICI